TTIVAAGEAVRSPSASPAERDELGASISEQARRLSDLVDKLLDLSRIQAGTARPRRDWCSIDEGLRAAIEEVHGESEIQVSVEAALPLVNADAAQLERAFANLLENAQRHSGGERIRVRARVVGGLLGVRIVDQGPGIPRRELSRIFEAFYQLDGGGG